MYETHHSQVAMHSKEKRECRSQNRGIPQVQLDVSARIAQQVHRQIFEFESAAVHDKQQCMIVKSHKK